MLYSVVAFKTLNTDTIEALVIAYKGTEEPEDTLSSLKRIWSVVEEYVKNNKLSSVGLSDINTNIFIELFQWANVRTDYLIKFVTHFQTYLKIIFIYFLDKAKHCPN